MSWYVAHIIIYLEFKEGPQDEFPVFENMHLIETDSFEGAGQKAEGIGRESEGDDANSLTYKERPCRRVFAGVRKVVECVNADERPADGVELTYNEFVLDSMESLRKLAAGKSIRVEYES